MTKISELDFNLAKKLLDFSEQYLSEPRKSHGVVQMAKDIRDSAKRIIEQYEKEKEV